MFFFFVLFLFVPLCHRVRKSLLVGNPHPSSPVCRPPLVASPEVHTPEQQATTPEHRALVKKAIDLGDGNAIIGAPRPGPTRVTHLRRRAILTIGKRHNKTWHLLERRTFSLQCNRARGMFFTYHNAREQSFGNFFFSHHHWASGRSNILTTTTHTRPRPPHRYAISYTPTTHDFSPQTQAFRL